VEPWAYLLTFACYGERLHGDGRGSVDPAHNGWRTPYLDADPSRQCVERGRMRKVGVKFSASDRRIVLQSIRTVCEHQVWTLHAAHVRSTHVHVVLSSTAQPETVMTKLKAYASRALGQTKRWSRHGSTGDIWNPHQLHSAIDYVVHGQGTSMACYPNP
jgi:hypothetical protein